MKIKFLFIGNTKEKFIMDGEKKYLEILKKFFEVENIFLKESKTTSKEKNIKIETEQILSKISPKDFLILLDLRGKELDSVSFSKEFEKILFGNSSIVFVVGGTFGVGDELFARANFSLSLSKMTFNHELCRVFLMEQVFRAISIIKGIGYHK